LVISCAGVGGLAGWRPEAKAAHAKNAKKGKENRKALTTDEKD
jgi:hypothetical protein